MTWASLKRSRGKGIRATVQGAKLLIGNDKLMADADVSVPIGLKEQKQALESQGKTAMLVAIDLAGSGFSASGLIAVRDEPRAAAKLAIQRLKDLGRETRRHADG